MPINSFRLFVVSLHDGRMRENQPFAKAQPRAKRIELEDGSTKKVEYDPVDYPSELLDDVNDKLGTAFVFGRKAVEDDDAEATAFGGHVIRWLKARRKGGGTRLWFEAGPVTSEGVLVDPAGIETDLDLGTDFRATLHPYRACLVTKDDLEYGILAVEARGMRCPRDQLVRALRESSDQPWSLRVREGVAQKAAVLDFIERANIQAVTFTEYGFGRDGAKKAPQLKRLRIDEVVGGFEEVKKAAKTWVQEKWKGRGAVAAKDLVGLVMTEETNIAFNDVAVEFDDEKQQRTIRPSTDYRRFSYFLGKDIVKDKKFFGTAVEAAEAIIDEVQTIVGEGE